MAQQQPQSKLPPRARYAANNRKYGTPLPILFPSSSSSSTSSKSILTSFLPSLSSTRVEIQHITGEYDPITGSVWITDPRMMDLAFQKGFFGKGSLSRSEPSWRARRVGLLKGGDTAEQMREKRRLERKQFKIDRAQAMLDAAKKAEAIIAAAKSQPESQNQSQLQPGDNDGDDVEEDGEGEGEGDEADVSLVVTPDIEVDLEREVETQSQIPAGGDTLANQSQMEIDPLNLTPQTFLVRPTRPDANRNRGRNAFRRRPPQSQAQGNTYTAMATPAPASAPAAEQPTQTPADADIEADEDLFDESLVEEMEHLQLSIEESLFLSLAIGVLHVYDPSTGIYLTPTSNSADSGELLKLLLPSPSPSSPLSTQLSISESKGVLLPDNPALVSYAVYHHFRSLGWVVKDGIKFCVDWLLYRRGPVFSHSAGLAVWRGGLNVIAVYITIPPLSSFPPSMKLADGTLDPKKNGLKSLLKQYTIREVALTRFGATRRRD
ncbi:tRNA-splicing endonuclease subunit Sen2 [Cryptococcus deuterogattii LA55]|nr:tRNA-splicing endonuclease subunit Sen2 [Cryptococcus deuterogattii LA55]KIR92472.1 tRNA-splicing endonuclease subunit Sen2 [Cryptococcus deuterogattii CBS 10090]KIS01638.1 tRNA-splicing endonuclease subunit Sen2 [Cryptococcus deuterogattii 2001/935-1]